MARYKRNKIKTAGEIIRRIGNWPTAFGWRGLRLLNLRQNCGNRSLVEYRACSERPALVKGESR